MIKDPKIFLNIVDLVRFDIEMFFLLLYLRCIQFRYGWKASKTRLKFHTDASFGVFLVLIC